MQAVLIFVVAFAFVVEELHALIKVEFLALIANAYKAFVCLISVELATGRNMHQQNSVLMTFRICAWQILALNLYRRIAEIERNSKQLIEPFLVSVNALNPSGLVRHSNSKHATICISHCHNRNC